MPQQVAWRYEALALHTSTSQVLTTISEERCFFYNNTESSINLHVGANGGARPNMKSLTSGLAVNGTTVSTDKRLKYNEKKLINLWDVINKLEPLDYDQTISLVEQCTEDTQQFHQCGFSFSRCRFNKPKN